MEDEGDATMDIQSEPTHEEELGNEKLFQSVSECTSPHKGTKHRNALQPSLWLPPINDMSWLIWNICGIVRQETIDHINDIIFDRILSLS